MKDALDWVETTQPLVIKPVKTGRSQLQIVSLAEDAQWLAPFLIATDIYICPSEAMVKVRKGAQ